MLVQWEDAWIFTKTEHIIFCRQQSMYVTRIEHVHHFIIVFIFN